MRSSLLPAPFWYTTFREPTFPPCPLYKNPDFVTFFDGFLFVQYLTRGSLLDGIGRLTVDGLMAKPRSF